MLCACVRACCRACGCCCRQLCGDFRSLLRARVRRVSVRASANVSECRQRARATRWHDDARRPRANTSRPRALPAPQRCRRPPPQRPARSFFGCAPPPAHATSAVRPTRPARHNTNTARSATQQPRRQPACAHTQHTRAAAARALGRASTAQAPHARAHAGTQRVEPLSAM